jgi:DNA-binding NtrC family response regulator
MVQEGRFQEDLYYRLNVIPIHIPPLRERRDDILPLVEHFARELGASGTLESTFGAETLTRWQRHPWPGNVRELRNAVEAAIVVGPHAYSDQTLAAPSTTADGPLLPYKDARAAIVREFERDYLVRLLAEANGNVSQAARTAKMDRSHLIDLLHRHGLKE